jgi:Protein of unknown function (DUF2585)
MIARGRVSRWWGWVLIVAAIMALQALALAIEGHPAICTCGYVKLWEGAANSAGNSQHLSDWYSFTHIIHGILFYALLGLIGRAWKLPFGTRLVLAVVIEAGWEVLENTRFVIERYRAATISLDYYGDSIINSLSDTSFMMIGFVLARLLPASATIAAAVALELFVGWSIRDNLTLNLIMLIHPLESIKAWQGGG